MRVKLVVKEPRLESPTPKAMSVTGRFGGAQQRRGALQAPGEQVLVGRFAVQPLEFAAEVGRRQRGRRGEICDGERVCVPGVGQVLGLHQVPSGRPRRHPATLTRVTSHGGARAGGWSDR